MAEASASVGLIKHGGFNLTLYYEWLEGRMECVGMDIRPTPKPGALDIPPKPGTEPEPLTTSRLRAIPLAKLIDKHRPAWTSSITTADMDGTIYTQTQDFRSRPRPRGGRRPKYGPEHYAEVARVYREAYASNRTPTLAVARHFKATSSAAAKWVAKCRDDGLLPKTSQGKARVEPRRKRRRKR